MAKPRILVLSLGGTITMVPSETGGITPKLGAAELGASVPALADIDAQSPFRLPSPSLSTANLVDVAQAIGKGFAAGFDGAVVIQGTDTIEESAFLLDLLVDSDKPGHVPADVAPLVGELAAKIPVVLASRAMTGQVFTNTYGYPGAEIDLIKRGVVPAGYLSGLKARLLLGLVRRGKGAASVAKAFAPYQ